MRLALLLVTALLCAEPKPGCLQLAAKRKLQPVVCALDPPQKTSDGRIPRDRTAVYAFRRHHPCPATGKVKGACPGYVIDHVMPLKRGGADRPENMQWQTYADSKAKDRWE